MEPAKNDFPGPKLNLNPVAAGWMDGWTDGRTDGRTDFFPTLHYASFCFVFFSFYSGAPPRETSKFGHFKQRVKFRLVCSRKSEERLQNSKRDLRISTDFRNVQTLIDYSARGREFRPSRPLSKEIRALLN